MSRHEELLAEAVRAMERTDWLKAEVERKDRAIDTALTAFAQLSKTGSLHREKREATVKQLTEARNERLF